MNLQRTRMLLAATAATSLLSGCGGGGGDSGTPGAELPTFSSATASATPRYSQKMMVTVNGTRLDQGLTLSSAGCRNFTRLSTAPNISTATTAYYECTVSGVGAQTLAITRSADGGTLGSVAYNVAVPQVTMTIGNGSTSLGSFVITLDPARAPITVDNFLNYVNTNWYVGTVFHRHAPGFVLQGGGYPTGVSTTNIPMLKATNPPITLEDNAGLSNLRLTVAMARTQAADSATSQFFINLVDNTGLDRTATARGYAVFGTVSGGSDVVAAMTASPCTPVTFFSECLPIPNLEITAATQTR
jgi:cyclophilin family peptidyl-prolyl cis-trans isomerase